MDLEKPLISFDPLWWTNADTRMIEAFSALVFLTFGLILFWPGDTLTGFGAYRVMREVAREDVWTGIFLFQWLLQSVAMCGKVRLLRFPAALGAFAIWLFVGTCYVASSPGGLGGYVFLWLAAFMLLVMWKGPTDGRV